MLLIEKVKDVFLSEPELITEKRYIRWKRVGITVLSLVLLLMILKALFAPNNAGADESKYKAVSPETVRKEGEVILHAGKYELRKNGSFEKSTSRYLAGTGALHEAGQVISRKDRARGEYIIPAGSKIRVVLEGELNSQLSQSPVVAQVVEGFNFQGRAMIPVGTKALGHVGQSADSGRLTINFDQLVFPNGLQVGAQSLAVMEDGSPGVVGDYHSGAWGKFAAGVGLSFVSGAAAALESSQANAFGFDQPEASTKNAILNGIARSTLDQGKRLGESSQNTAGYVTLGGGAPFQIYFEHEVDLSGVLL